MYLMCNLEGVMGISKGFSLFIIKVLSAVVKYDGMCIIYIVCVLI